MKCPKCNRSMREINILRYECDSMCEDFAMLQTAQSEWRCVNMACRIKTFTVERGDSIDCPLCGCGGTAND